jgi:hypothetical protein
LVLILSAFFNVELGRGGICRNLYQILLALQKILQL